MKIRTCTIDDFDEILAIYSYAREFMKQNSNPTQWGDNYPQVDILKNNIEDKKLYICFDDERILGVFYFAIEDDATYKMIYDGEWLNDRKYAVIHRIAVAKNTSGVASFCFEWALKIHSNIKIDTHRDNIPMQKCLQKNGFTQCGIIYLLNGDERIAYQKSL